MQIRLSDLMHGKIQRQFDEELDAVIQNIEDPRMDIKAKRKITIDMTFEYDELSGNILVLSKLKTKLETPMPEATMIDIHGKDGWEEVKIGKEEQIAGQRHIDKETGEIMDDDSIPAFDSDRKEQKEQAKA